MLRSQTLALTDLTGEESILQDYGFDLVDNLHTGNEEDAKLFDSEGELSPTEQLADDEIGRTLQSVTDGVDESGFMRPTAKRKATPRPANTFNVGDRSFVSRGSSGSTDFIIFQESLFQRREPQHKLPCEGSFGKMLSLPKMDLPKGELPTIGKLESSFALVADSSQSDPRPVRIAKQRLLSAKVAASDDHLFELALRKVREIIFYNLRVPSLVERYSVWQVSYLQLT